jgi:hypothetical protein
MKTTNLINNHEATKPMDLTELMLVNALNQIEELEDEIGSLKTIVERQDKILKTLKKAAEFRKSDYMDYINIEWIRRDDEGFQELMEAFGLEDEAEETAEKEEEDNE